MMWLSYLLMTLLFVVGSLLIFIILLQRGRGGGLAGALGGMGGQSAFGTKAGDFFTRVTVVLAVIWIVLCAGQIPILRAVGKRFVAGDNTAPQLEAAPLKGAGKAFPKDGDNEDSATKDGDEKPVIPVAPKSTTKPKSTATDKKVDEKTDDKAESKAEKSNSGADKSETDKVEKKDADPEKPATESEPPKTESEEKPKSVSDEKPKADSEK